MVEKREKEYEKAMNNTQKMLLQVWDEIVFRTCNRFSLENTLVEKDSTIACEDPLSWPYSFKCRVDSNGTITIPNITETSAPLLQAILSREALCCLLEEENLDDRPLFDIACEYGLQTLKLKNVSLWEKEWIKYSPEVTMPNGIRYRPHSMFEVLRRLSEKEGLNLLVQRVSSLVRLGIHVFFEEWVGYFFRFIREYNHPLTDLEVKILHHLLNNPDTTRRELSSKIKASSDWIGKMIAAMKDRGQLREFDYLSLPALGIKTFQIILLHGKNSVIDSSTLITGCPFLFSMHRIPFGRGGLFATLCIPDNPKNLRYLNRMINVAAKNGIDASVYERVRSRSIYNLHCYNSQSKSWDIDWSSLQLEAEVVNATGVTSLYPGIIPEPKERVFQCDGLDTQILVEFQKGRTTVANLRKIVKKRTADVVSRLNRFRELGIINHFWELHYVGLNNDLIILCPTIEVSKIVTSIAIRLPKSFINLNESNLLLLRTQLPTGGAVHLAKTLHSLDTASYTYILDTQEYGQWNLGDFIQDWNSYTGQWHPYEGPIDRWLNSIDST